MSSAGLLGLGSMTDPAGEHIWRKGCEGAACCQPVVWSSDGRI